MFPNGKTVMRKRRGVFVGDVGGCCCHPAGLHCGFLSLYKNFSLSISISSDLYGGGRL